MEESEPLGTVEAGKILGLHPDYVKRLAATGKIPAKRIGRSWVFSLDALRGYRPAPVGNPNFGAGRKRKKRHQK